MRLRLWLAALAALLPLAPLHASDDALFECRAAGYGYLRVPGSDLCIAPRGFVRADFLGGFRLPPFNLKSDTLYGTIAKTQIGVDFVSTGDLPTGGRVRIAIARENGLPTVWTDGLGGQRTLVDLDEAWIRAGPFMAGRGPSRFDFYRDAFNYTPLPVSDLTANFFAARAPLTDRLYAEVSIEDSYERANGLIPVNPRLNSKPDFVGVLRASVSWPYPGELHVSVASPRSSSQFLAWQAGAAFDLGGEKPHLLILQGGMARGPPSFLGADRGMMQAIAGADIGFADTTALRGANAIIVYRRPFYGDNWTLTNFAGFAMIKPVLAFNSELTGPAAMMMAGANLEWRSRQGLTIGGEFAYVASETPASPYTRYGEGMVFRLRIQRGF